MKNILCYGDSNTYGYRPDGLGRYDENIRWTCRLQKLLGHDEYNIIEEGLCGRTTVFDDELRYGRKGIEAIGVVMESHNPIDTIIIMLGTNDCKKRYGAEAPVIARGIGRMIDKVRALATCEVRILIVSPILLGKGVGDPGFDSEFDSNSEVVSRGLEDEYEKIAYKKNCDFLKAGLYAEASKIDREHLDEVGHKQLARAIADKLFTMKI